MPVGASAWITRSMKPGLLIAAVSAATVAAPATAAAPPPFKGVPTPAVISYNLTPVVNQELAKNHWTRWRFGKAICEYTSTRGMYLCTAPHIAGGVPVDGYSDVWQVDFKGGRWSFKPSSVCPLDSGRCVHTDTTPLVQPQQ